MSELTIIRDSIQSVIEAVRDERAGMDRARVPSADAARVFAACLEGAVLPRRATLRALSGARLSVSVKNRRILKVVEAQPETLWPEPLTSDDPDRFIIALAAAIATVARNEDVLIEEQAPSETDMQTDGFGCPAALLRKEIEAAEAAAESDAASALDAFYEAFDGWPRAQFGDAASAAVQTEIGVLTKARLEAQAAALAQAMAGEANGLRFLIFAGAEPLALAAAWVNGRGRLAASADPEQFHVLQERLFALRDHL